MKNETYLPLEQALADHDRVEYFRGNMEALLATINEDGVDVKGYFGWSESFTMSCPHSPSYVPRSLGQLRVG